MASQATSRKTVKLQANTEENTTVPQFGPFRGIHEWFHKGPLMRTMFPHQDAFVVSRHASSQSTCLVGDLLSNYLFNGSIFIHTYGLLLLFFRCSAVVKWQQSDMDVPWRHGLYGSVQNVVSKTTARISRTNVAPSGGASGNIHGSVTHFVS